jgi:hypothetical protein
MKMKIGMAHNLLATVRMWRKEMFAEAAQEVVS